MRLKTLEEATLIEILHHIHRKHPELISSLNLYEIDGFDDWKGRDFDVPVPRQVKLATLIRHSITNAVWIETGTHRGDTTDVLGNIASRVFSLEPMNELFDFATVRFANRENITILNGTSEVELPKLLAALRGRLNLWLDGHYSGDGTFAGPNDTPLLAELSTIDTFSNNFDCCAVFIDDIRLCGRRHAYGDYPSLDYLVDWARRGGWTWGIEYDIFIAKK